MKILEVQYMDGYKLRSIKWTDHPKGEKFLIYKVDGPPKRVKILRVYKVDGSPKEGESS